MRKKLITKLLVATILSMTISTGIAYAKTDTKNIDETNNKIVEEQQKSIINKEKQDIITIKGLSQVVMMSATIIDQVKKVKRVNLYGVHV